jgi:hypothetical protein
VETRAVLAVLVCVLLSRFNVYSEISYPIKRVYALQVMFYKLLDGKYGYCQCLKLLG